MQNRLTRTIFAGRERSFTGSISRETALTCMFGAFVFLQFTTLGLANHAGEGYLSTAQRELIYYGLQIFVISGYLLYSLFFRSCRGKQSRNAAAAGVLGLYLACVTLIFSAGYDSLLNVIVSMIAALCIGAMGGAAHGQMSREAAAGAPVARCMGVGSSAAIIMQFLLQIQWGVTPLMPVFGRRRCCRNSC